MPTPRISCIVNGTSGKQTSVLNSRNEWLLLSGRNIVSAIVRVRGATHTPIVCVSMFLLSSLFKVNRRTIDGVVPFVCQKVNDF